MNINDLVSDLSPEQVNQILIDDGVESRDTITNVKNQGECLYSYDVFNMKTKTFTQKLVKICIHPDFNFLTIEYKKIVRH